MKSRSEWRRMRKSKIMREWNSRRERKSRKKSKTCRER